MRYISMLAALGCWALCSACMSQASAAEIIFIPSLTENGPDGAPLKLLVTVHRPEGPGSFPLLVLNHGSTGVPIRWGAATQRVSAVPVWQFFLERGYAVVEPMRRGRGGSEGEYAEGIVNGQYVCEREASDRGIARAIEDIHSAVSYFRKQPWVERRKVIVGGISRGGILSLAYAGRHPDEVLGVVNFVGGWLADLCSLAAEINSAAFAVAGASYKRPTLWIYGEYDGLYSIAHSRANFDAFRRAGGEGEFLVFNGGHWVSNRPHAWGPSVDAYLTGLSTR